MLETFGQVGIVLMFSVAFIVMVVMFTTFVIVVMMLVATFVVMVMLVSLNCFGLLRKAENEVFRVRMSDYAHTA